MANQNEERDPHYISSAIIGCGSVPIEENGQIIHHCRDYYEWDPNKKEWIPISLYDDVTKKWIDIEK